ncbi:MAG: 4Fe-4S dicluster domain-containing protein [Eubacteriales bacterium]|nr:4Fe-4S dicluster domain-containing protein [Eubacteriales bacterium]
MNQKDVYALRMMAGACFDCGECTAVCPGILKEHNLTLQGFAYSPELYEECVRCGVCFEVCPKGIDGIRIAEKAEEALLANN